MSDLAAILQNFGTHQRLIRAYLDGRVFKFQSVENRGTKITSPYPSEDNLLIVNLLKSKLARIFDIALIIVQEDVPQIDSYQITDQ